ncbi:MAG TPA: folylpolyglutamate synthase/dihydrofolate synthase family protein [Candidatus Cybelea sp.]|nr:folylpolyglutamate synthase/dihydrofolate synthase family protein [Candidatus Cybelea sp.]
MIRITSFQAAQTYLLGTIDEAVSPRTSYKLDRMRAFLRNLGDPHRAYPTIHVGGTSGKGSTATMIASALRASGKRTGLHTKPHLHSMTERAQIDGASIESERFARLLADSMPAIERTIAQFGQPTYYETLLGLAFAYFAAEKVDVAVIEVGLGGRLDGTNVLEPVIAAITSVGYDHVEILGTTLEAIALEKAGIAKPGVPLVVGSVPEAARRVIERYAAEVGAPVVLVRDAVEVGIEQSDVHGAVLNLQTSGDRYAIELPVLGIFQRSNAATAVAVLERLGELRPDREAIQRGFAALTIPGRMEFVSSKPPVLFDIAHNVEKAEALVASLQESFGGRRIHYVVSIGESKDARRILEVLAKLPSTFTFTSYSTAGRKAIPASRLSTIAESFGSWGRAVGDPIEALTIARRIAAIEDVVVVTGSTFIVGRLREWFVPASV